MDLDNTYCADGQLNPNIVKMVCKNFNCCLQFILIACIKNTSKVRLFKR